MWIMDYVMCNKKSVNVTRSNRLDDTIRHRLTSDIHMYYDCLTSLCRQQLLISNEEYHYAFGPHQLDEQAINVYILKNVIILYSDPKDLDSRCKT